MLEAAAESVALNPLRVLVAEDDDDLRALLIAGLELEGHRVVDLEDGFELEDYLELSNRQVSRRLQPDVIVTDEQMPGRTGLEVLREARSQGLTCPCVVISGFADETLRAAVEKLAPAFVLRKPFDLEEVIELVARVARR